MQLFKTDYNRELLGKWKNEVNEARIDGLLQNFVARFDAVVTNVTQRAHFQTYLKGLMSDLDRKSIEPMALALGGEEAVRPMQQFITRSTMKDCEVSRVYREILSETINSENGMFSVDDTGHVKKGKNSVGVKRQYCGRLGKVENCQVVVNAAYAGSNGYGLVDCELYIPEEWFNESHKDLRIKCNIPEDKMFRTKNEIALELIEQTFEENLLNIKWIGADSSFGGSHKFIDALPKNALYFVGVPKDERVFLFGSDIPVCIETIAHDDEFEWEKVGFDTSKGVRNSDIKIVRAFNCRDSLPKSEIWVYIRRYADGKVRYAIAGAPANTTKDELHEASRLRWPIEQCFQECKSNLGMADFEGRSYNGFMRHLLLVMITHLFATSLRLEFKKTTSR